MSKAKTIDVAALVAERRKLQAEYAANTRVRIKLQIKLDNLAKAVGLEALLG